MPRGSRASARLRERGRDCWYCAAPSQALRGRIVTQLQGRALPAGLGLWKNPA